MKLYTKILIGMIAGVILGWILNVVYDQDLFQVIDTNGDHYISFAEYENSEHAQNIKASKSEGGLTQDSLIKLSFIGLDINGNESINLSEFKSVHGWQRFVTYIKPVGTIFINLVKMLVVPLIFVSLVLGAASLGDIRKVGKMGAKAFGFFIFTTAIAVVIGLGCANLIQPGAGIDEESRKELMVEYEKEVEKQQSKNKESVDKLKNSSTAEKVMDLFVRMVPKNPIGAMANGDMLGVIFFSLFLGICITLIPPEKSQFLIQMFDGLNDAVIKMVTLAMEFAPYGVFALMASVVSKLGIGVMQQLAWYALAVILGLILHVVITHFSFIYFYLKQSPIKFIAAIKEAILFAFSTSSSSATLPISLNVAQTNLGVSREISSFVLPLGATINMDGTALYQAVAALFIAQVFLPYDLTFVTQLTIVLTATLASIGAAGVPGAGMITLALVLTTAGIPEEGIALIFGLDRILDMCRTVINISGDLTLTMVMAKSEGETINIQTGKDMIPG